MNIIKKIIINLLFLILCKVSDIKTKNNSQNKEKKIRLLEDTSKKNSILILIEAKSEREYNYLYEYYFNNIYQPTKLYLNNTNINFTSSTIYLKAGNHSIEIVFGTQNITSLNLSNFNTNNVNNMNGMFSYCSSLTSLDLSNFNTNNVINMNGMFFNCSSLTSLKLSNFNTTNVENMEDMFSGLNKDCEIFVMMK